VQKAKSKRKHKVKQIIAYINTTYRSTDRYGKTHDTRNVTVQSTLCARPINQRYSGSTITGKKCLVPHRQLIEYHNLKRAAPQLRQFCVPMCSAARAVILLALAMDITVNRRVALRHTNFFAMLAKTQAKLQSQLTGVTISLRDSQNIIGSAYRG
jgi:hypothetical protein